MPRGGRSVRPQSIGTKIRAVTFYAQLMYNSIKKDLCKAIFQKICLSEIYTFRKRTGSDRLFLFCRDKKFGKPQADGLDNDAGKEDHGDIHQDEKGEEGAFVLDGIRFEQIMPEEWSCEGVFVEQVDTEGTCGNPVDDFAAESRTLPAFFSLILL